MSRAMETLSRNRRLTAGLALLVGLIVVAVGISQIDTMIAALEWVQTAGPVGFAVFAAVYFVATLLMAPASWLMGSAGFLFGPFLGFAVASLGSAACGSVSFVLAKTVLRDFVARRVERDPSFLAVDEAIEEGGSYLVGLLRLSPLSPYNVVSYALGLTRVSYREYLLGTVVGSLPAAILYPWLGSSVSSLAELMEGGNMNEMAPQLVIIASTLVATVLVARFAKAALADAMKAARA